MRFRRAVVQSCRRALLFLAVASSCLSSLTPPGAASAETLPLSGPRIRVEGEAFDFGLLPQDVFATHTYWLKNPGTETVRIQRLAPNCGCTLAPLTDSVIAVGDSVPVEVTFGTRSMIGHVEKHTRIFANATGRIPTLTFTADVAPDTADSGPVRIKPRRVLVDPSTQPASGDWSITIAVRNTSRRPIEVRVVDLPRYSTLNPSTLSLGPGEEHPVTITLSPLPEGSLGRSVTFELSDPPGVHLTVPIMRTKQ